MAKIFWLCCPKCEKEFYAHYGDFRRKERDLRCPFCSTSFRDTEAKIIRE